MAYRRAAVSAGNLPSVSRMKGRYGSIRLGRSGEQCTGALLPASTRRTASRWTCNCRAMIPTRHFSTACRRRICATRSGASVMAPPRWHHGAQAVAQEALAHPKTERRGASAARSCKLGGFGVRHRRGIVRRRVRDDDGSVQGPCEQWSIGRGDRTTLVRHVLCSVDMAPTPVAGPRRVRQAAAPRALIAAGGLAAGCIACLAPAGAAAVTVAAVTAAAQHHLGAAAGAQEHASHTDRLHAHLAQAERAGRTRPSAPHCCGTAFIGTV